MISAMARSGALALTFWLSVTPFARAGDGPGTFADLKREHE